jgi:hypothetical protein
MKFLSQINVNTEYTLPIVDGTNGQVLATDGNGTAYWGSISAGATNLDALTDVILTSPSSGQLLRYGIPPGSGEAQPVWYNFTPNYLTPSSSIDNLGDVTITSAATGQVLQWSGSAWVNATITSAGYVSKVQHEVKAGVAITKGQAVYVTSADGTNIIVGLASNASEATSSKTMGLALANASVNGKFFVVTEGLIDGLNTQGANAGDAVWLGTGGNLIFGLTNKPVAPAHLVYLGVVTRANQNNGEIFVSVQNGVELNEIHDVLINGVSAGQLLRRDSDGLWKNWTPNYLTSLPTHNHDDRYYTENEIAAFFGGETPIAGYNQTNWDTAYGWGNHATAGYLTSQPWNSGTGSINYTAGNVGIGTAVPGSRLSVSGTNSGSVPLVDLVASGSGAFQRGVRMLNSSMASGDSIMYAAGRSDNSKNMGQFYFYYAGAGSNSNRISMGLHSVDDVFNITGASNVGVGTTTPTQKFEVSGGAIIASGFGNRAAGTGKALEIGMDGTSAVLQAYDRTASTYIPININSSSAVFNGAAYASSFWATNYGPRDSNGNINFVDWSSNVIARINRVSGVASVGNRKLSMGILDINSQGTPEIRINTKIPFALGAADFTVNIKGFQYGGTNMMSLSIGWHYYLSQFYNETAISNGAFAPNITLAVDESNMVVIHLSNVGYWPKLYVESVYSSAYADDYVANWSWTDAGVDALSSVTPVTYKPLDTSITGNAAYASTAGNSSTTSQTNFSTLTVSNNTVATQAWVQAQGYASSFSETDTLATVTGRGATTSTPITITGTEGREVAVYMPSSYGANDLVSGHEYGWYSDHWRIGMTRSFGAAGADFVVQWNGARRLSLSNDGNLTISGTFTEQSSIRFKENIQPLEPALAKVEQLNPVTYNKIGVVEEEIGLIAEEVAELFPEVVTYNEEGQPQGIQYQRLSVILLKAVQELTERVNKLENK